MDDLEIGERAIKILNQVAAMAPELVLLSLDKLSVRYFCLCSHLRVFKILQAPMPTFVASMHSRILTSYLTASPSSITSSQLVFHQMYNSNPEGLLSALLTFYAEDENRLGRVVEIAHELNVSETS